SIGVRDARFVAHDRHVALPEQKVAALRRSARLFAERALLHVAVARAADATSHERELNQGGAVEPETGAPAPQIRHADETFGDRNEILLDARDRHEMTCRH